MFRILLGDMEVNMKEFKWVWQYLEKYKYKFMAALLLSFSAVLISMVNPYVQGTIVDKVIKGGNTGILAKLLFLMLGATLVKSVIRYIYQCTFETVSQGVVFKIRETIYHRIQKLDFEFFDETKTGDIMSRMTGDLEAVRHFTSFVIYQVFYNALTFITAMTALFIINFKLTLLLLAVTPIIGFLTYKMAGDVKPLFTAIREQFSKLNSVVQENISGNRVVKAFAKEDYEIYKFSRENEAFKDRNLDAAKVWEKYLPVLDSMAGVLSVVIIIAGGIMVINKSLTLGELVTFNSFIWALNGPMRMAGWLINDVQRFAACAEKIMSMLQREPRIKSPAKPVQKERVLGRVEFRNVGFNYRDCKVLSGISFKALPGQTIAIVGPTGSGKTTLVNLLSRFYDCTEGEVLVDDVNIKAYDLMKLRKNVAIAMQDIFLFSDTIEGNIAYGVPDAPVEKVEWAAEVAGAHGFITGFTESYDTIIGERGVGLSGGQRQRIALARALIKDPSILVLDDTTSSVDIETEHEIQKTLKGFYSSKTTFIIAHRISSVKNADLILVLDNGRIVERGTHAELLEGKGYYYNVFINQYGDFDKDFSEQAG